MNLEFRYQSGDGAYLNNVFVTINYNVRRLTDNLLNTMRDRMLGALNDLLTEIPADRIFGAVGHYYNANNNITRFTYARGLRAIENLIYAMFETVESLILGLNHQEISGVRNIQVSGDQDPNVTPDDYRMGSFHLRIQFSGRPNNVIRHIQNWNESYQDVFGQQSSEEDEEDGGQGQQDDNQPSDDEQQQQSDNDSDFRRRREREELRQSYLILNNELNSVNIEIQDLQDTINDILRNRSVRGYDQLIIELRGRLRDINTVRTRLTRDLRYLIRNNPDINDSLSSLGSPSDIDDLNSFNDDFGGTSSPEFYSPDTPSSPSFFDDNEEPDQSTQDTEIYDRAILEELTDLRNQLQQLSIERDDLRDTLNDITRNTRTLYGLSDPVLFQLQSRINVLNREISALRRRISYINRYEVDNY